MRIVDAYWTPKVNMIVVLCDCGHRRECPTNRKVWWCNHCNRRIDVMKLKQKGMKV